MKTIRFVSAATLLIALQALAQTDPPAGSKMLKIKPTPTAPSSEAGVISLKVGDAAPALQVAKWAQGEPVGKFTRDHAYIVEFWATWCGPCVVSIPHLNEMHNKFKDRGLVVIGQDCWERDESLVAPFIKKMGDQMTYRVAHDLKSDEQDKGRMAVTWMEAAGQHGIPTAFVVSKEGRIAWIGHPMQLQDLLIEQVLTGTFDIAKAAAVHELLVKNEPVRRAAVLKLSQAMRAKQWNEAAAAWAELEKVLPEEGRENYASTRFHILVGQGRAVEAMKLARQVSDEHRGEATLNNELAWAIATTAKPSQSDLELAALIADRSNQAAQGKNPAFLDTLARVQFLQGKQAAAVATQQKAADLVNGSAKTRYLTVLDAYKQGRLPVED